MRPRSSLNSTVKETLISEISFEVVWRWKRRLASEPLSKQLGGTTSILKCVSRNLIRIWKGCCTQIPCGSIPWKCVTDFRSIAEEAWADTNYNQSLIIWLYKMISDSTKRMKGNFFSHLPMNWVLLTPQSHLILEKRMGAAYSVVGRTQHTTNSPRTVFDFLSISQWNILACKMTNRKLYFC